MFFMAILFTLKFLPQIYWEKAAEKNIFPYSFLNSGFICCCLCPKALESIDKCGLRIIGFKTIFITFRDLSWKINWFHELMFYGITTEVSALSSDWVNLNTTYITILYLGAFICIQVFLFLIFFFLLLYFSIFNFDAKSLAMDFWL